MKCINARLNKTLGYHHTLFKGTSLGNCFISTDAEQDRIIRADQFPHPLQYLQGKTQEPLEITPILISPLVGIG